MNKPAIILVNPQLGENIGMCARAMFNCGLSDLRLVAPRDGWPNASADAASAGALEKGVAVSIYDTTAAAIADCHFTLATTARPRDMVKDIFTPKSAAQKLHGTDQKTAILFGAERSGLVNDDIAIANGVITIPLNPDFTSLNIAQAVLVVSYEWFCVQDGTPDAQFSTGDANVANADEIANLVTRLSNEMDQGGFFRSPDMKPSLVRNLQAFFSRTRMTDQEINTFHGIISALIRK